MPDGRQVLLLIIFGYIQFIPFLSFDEFKFMKSVKRLGCNGLDHAMMRPFGRMCRLRRRGDILGGCARFVRAYMMYQFNAIQHVLEHVMNNIIL